MSAAIGVDVGGGHIACAAVSLPDGEIVGASECRRAVDNQAGKDEILRCWSEGIAHSIAHVGGLAVIGIGFAMPGPFDYRNGIALFEGNDKYDALYGVDVERALASHFAGPPPMRFINDATAFGVGATWRGGTDGQRRAAGYRTIAVTLGTGFGSAFIDADKPVTTGSSVPEHGCLWHLPFGSGIADDYISTRWFVREFAAIRGWRPEGVREVAEIALDDPDVRSLFVQFGDNLAAVLLPWIKQFSADVLIIGGNVAGAYDLFSGPLRAAMSRYQLKVVVEVNTQTESTALRGGARLFDDSFWKKVCDELPQR